METQRSSSASARSSKENPRSGAVAAPTRRSRPTQARPTVRWAFTKGFLIGCVLEVPTLSAGVWVLAQLGIGDPAVGMMQIMWLTTVFAGLAAVFTAGGIGRLAASVTVERGRGRAIYVAVRAHAIAGAGLLVIATIPHGHLPLDRMGWFWIAVTGLVPGALCGAAIGWVCSRASQARLSDVWSAASRPSTALRTLFDPRDIVKLGSALRTRTSTLFDGMFEPAAQPPKNPTKPPSEKAEGARTGEKPSPSKPPAEQPPAETSSAPSKPPAEQPPAETSSAPSKPPAEKPPAETSSAPSNPPTETSASSKEEDPE